MTIDIFNGVGRNPYFAPVERHLRTGIDILADIAARHFNAEYCFIAGEISDGLEIFGRFGHATTRVSMSDGIRARLGRWDDVIFVTSIADERRLTGHRLLTQLGCLNGSLLSVSSIPRPGLGQTGVSVISTYRMKQPSPADITFLQSIAESAAHYIDSIYTVRKMTQQEQTIWQNIDEFTVALSKARLPIAIFDTEGVIVEKNQSWTEMKQVSEISDGSGVSENPMPPFQPENVDQCNLTAPETLQNIDYFSKKSDLINKKKNEDNIDVFIIKSLIIGVIDAKECQTSESIKFKIPSFAGSSKIITSRLSAYPIFNQKGTIGYVGIICYRDEDSKSENSISTSFNESRLDFSEHLVSFLDDTLKRNRSSKWRGEVEYTFCRKWAAPLKIHQIMAVKTLKYHPNEKFILICARDIVSLAIKKFGKSFNAIVPVPCGNTGSNICFSTRLARSVAHLTELPYIEAFPHSGLTGGSGPHKAKLVCLPPPTIETSGPVLLVDDVVTTGTHLERYATALKNAGVAAFSIAWVGPHDTHGGSEQKLKSSSKR